MRRDRHRLGSQRARRALLAACALLSLALAAPALAGCSTLADSVTATVPTSGPIEQGQQLGVDAQDHFIRVIARGPEDGMTPTQIVTGFLEASASFDDGHAVAREYLTEGASLGWDTDAGVRVYDGAAEITDLAQTVVLNASLSGSIAPDGHLDVAAPGKRLREEFRVVRDGSEWRIDELPQGLLLSQQDVDRAFRSYAVYYFNPQFDMLVPDARLVPVTGSSLATTLVRRLVNGPTEWLLPAVRTGFPAGVRLNIDSVPVDGGVARIDLNLEARKATDSAREAMSQQLVWTLRQVPDVQRVEITAAGQPLAVPGQPVAQAMDAWPDLDPNRMAAGAAGYARRAEGIVRLVADSVQPVAGGFGSSEEMFVDLAVAADESRLAAVGIDGSVWQGQLALGVQPIQVSNDGTALSTAFYRSDAAWVVDARKGLLSVSPAGTVTPIQVQGLGAKAQVLRAVPSRDGTRVALIVRRGPRTVLLVARVLSGVGSAGDVTVSEPRRVESALTEVLDLSWSAADSLSVLGSETLGTIQAYEVDVATGELAAGGTPVQPATIAAAPGFPTLVGSTDGLVYESTAGAWIERVRGSSPTYPN